ncbi:MAG: hypothetical protein HYV75_09770 [Opitutae bacterium]|nr:hypothetical protein [Opitutae bacterium]
MSTADVSPPRSSRLLSPPAVFLVLLLAGYSAFALLPELRVQLGISAGGRWFIDSYAVLAASDAVRAGLDPFQLNPLDPFQRPHSYSSWWFRLGDLGLTREDNFLVGGTWVLLFFAAVPVLLRPRTHGAALWTALVVLSPPVLLAVNRANNDLVVFALLVVGLWVSGPAAWRQALFAAILVVATGLKFYPVVAVSACLLVRPPRRMLVAGGLAVLAGGLTIASVWGDLQRAVIPWPNHIHTIGAAIIFRDLGWTGQGALLAGLGLVSLLGAVCAGRGWATGLAEESAPAGERRAFMVGATVLVVCFLAGISHAYRLIFALMLVPWLWRRAAAANPAARERGMARLMAGLLLTTLWFDGLLCLLVNTVLHPDSSAAVAQWESLGRAISQPVSWAVMVLLAGWLLDAAVAAGTAWWKGGAGR